MSVDPLAEKYPYNGVYNFSENRVVDNRELEGMEGVDYRMRLNEAVNNASQRNITVQEYMEGTSIRNIKFGSLKLKNFKYKTGTGTLWSSDANPNNMDRMTPEEKAHSDDHQPWSIDMDNGFNIMLSSYRPSGTDNNLYNVAKNFDSTVDAVNEVTQDNTGQTGNIDTTQNAGNNTGSGDNVIQNAGNNSGQQSTDTTIVVPTIYYSSQHGNGTSEIIIDVSINTQKNKVLHVIDSINKKNEERKQRHQ